MIAKRLLLSLLVTGLVVLNQGIVHAQSDVPMVEAADQTAIRTIIEMQLDAFGRDDAVAAYSYAAPNIQQQFVNSDIFIRMVQTGYPMVYRHQSAEFQEIVTFKDAPAQKVLFTGNDGTSALAVYHMQRQADGSWRIGGCFLVPLDGKLYGLRGDNKKEFWELSASN